jgi:AGZA family xanthine/uracil permease-like MFS transporter
VPARHAPAVAICFLPAVADVCLILVNQMLGGAGTSAQSLHGPAASTFLALEMLAAGFVLSAMLLGSATAFVIDGRMRAAAITLVIAAIAALFGVIHSPLPGGAAFLPWRIETSVPFAVASGYVGVAALVVLLRGYRRTRHSSTIR